MRTVGLDPASCTGMALVEGAEGRGKTIHLPEQRAYLRLHLIARQVEDTLRVWQPELVAIEGYAYVQSVGTFVTLVEIGTVIRQVLYKRYLPWLEIPPTVLKKWTTGKGNATKDQMAVAVKARWGYASLSHDIVDAFALAQFAQQGVDEALKHTGVRLG